MSQYILPFTEITLADLPRVGGKNASLGEMIHSLSSKEINIPGGFAVTAAAYRLFIEANNLGHKIPALLGSLNEDTLDNLAQVGKACRSELRKAVLPDVVKQEIAQAYHEMYPGREHPGLVAARSSATAEDLPTASFAGQHDSFLNIQGDENLLNAVHRCYISLFNDRAIKYRIDNGFPHLDVAISVGVQYMVRADKASAGVAFTVEPESGNNNIIYITGAWGLGEAIVQGAVNPDEYYFFKPALHAGKKSLIYRKAGFKENMAVFNPIEGENPVINVPTPVTLRQQLTLSEKESLQLAEWCYKIEQHYNMSMDIEWAKDGETNQMYILQARPETVHRQEEKLVIKEYRLEAANAPVCTGKAVGTVIVCGKVRIINSLLDANKVKDGDIIVADITNPDWNALLRKAVSIVTNKGGRTSHASIVARELGIPAVVGTIDATDKLRDGQIVTVSCAYGDEGLIYDGQLDWDVKEWQIGALKKTKTQPMLIMSDPAKAFKLSGYPSEGVGLMRMEFAINNIVKVHPMALVKYHELPDSKDKQLIASLCGTYKNKTQYFIDKLSEAIAMVAAAFYPRDVVVRMSDFKTNEYAGLIGGGYFEPGEENPMLGFRGASRYYNERYKEAFGLECAAAKTVRDEMGLTNVKLMIPFCRTVHEGEQVLNVMKEFGLERGKNGLEVYVMAEIPSNVILAERFAAIFDGFSIGSNDLTQLTLGLDRDSAIVSDLFDENDEAVKIMLKQVISAAKKSKRKIGLCGQAPSDYPDFTKFLVEQGIDSISFNPDALARGIEHIVNAEKLLQQKEELA